SSRSHPYPPFLLNTEVAMERELTPVEARGGIISGRIVTLLVISLVGAVIAMGGAWAFLGVSN
ncbi:MAG TPA: hypothetical protein VI232_01015, partial [Reyranella sp.]